jgi:hypothetical protein
MRERERERERERWLKVLPQQHHQLLSLMFHQQLQHSREFEKENVKRELMM